MRLFVFFSVILLQLPACFAFQACHRRISEGSSTPNLSSGAVGAASRSCKENSNDRDRKIPRHDCRGGGFRDKVKKGRTSTALQQTSAPYDTGSKCPVTGVATIAASLWGAGGVIYILAKAIKRVFPVALEPFQEGSVALSKFQLGIYILTCVWFAYVEGYKGFQQKFSPLVVKRSFTLIPGKNGTKWYHFLLAPLYSMGLLHATKKRKIVSWSVSIGVALIVAAVKRLPYPWRNIIDGGVIAGLSWGSISILLFYIRSWMTGEPPSEVSAELPTSTSP